MISSNTYRNNTYWLEKNLTMKREIQISAFTLIELIVSITIFSIIMISVISIFIFSSDLSWKIEINRVMQINIKNAVETIAEDIRKNGIQGISPWTITPICSWFTSGVIHWDKLCTGTSEYFLWKYDEIASDWIRVSASDCSDIQDVCTLVRHDWASKFPLTNSFITLRDLEFIISWDDIHKVTVRFHAQPSVKKSVKSDLIKNNEIYFQTTISERLIKFR